MRETNRQTQTERERKIINSTCYSTSKLSLYRVWSGSNPAW